MDARRDHRTVPAAGRGQVQAVADLDDVLLLAIAVFGPAPGGIVGYACWAAAILAICRLMPRAIQLLRARRQVPPEIRARQPRRWFSYLWTIALLGLGLLISATYAPSPGLRTAAGRAWRLVA
jgi:hypothetical protein